MHEVVTYAIVTIALILMAIALISMLFPGIMSGNNVYVTLVSTQLLGDGKFLIIKLKSTFTICNITIRGVDKRDYRYVCLDKPVNTTCIVLIHSQPQSNLCPDNVCILQVCGRGNEVCRTLVVKTR